MQVNWREMRAVLAALLANLGIAITKFIAFLLTGSASMLAESVHSVADTGNQVLLLVGRGRSNRPRSEDHPFGIGRECLSRSEVRLRDAVVHQHLMLEHHVGHDVAFEIDARRDFDQFERSVDGPKNRALGHEHRGAPLLLGEARVVTDLLDCRHELAGTAFGKNTQAAAGTFDPKPAGRECAAEHDFAGVLADVDETADADDLAAEAADVDIAARVDLV